MLKKNLIAIIAACLSIELVCSAPIDEAGFPLVRLPNDAQNVIFDMLPPTESFRLGATNSQFKHLTDRKRIVDALVAQHGAEAIKGAGKLGIRDAKLYDALLQKIGPHDGNHDNAAYIAALNGDVNTLEEWRRRYHRLPDSARIGAGNIDALRYALSHTSPAHQRMNDVIGRAAADGKTEFLHEIQQEMQRRPHPSSFQNHLPYAVTMAAKNGHFDTVDDIIARNQGDDYMQYQLHEGAFTGAAGNGNVARMKQHMPQMLFPQDHFNKAYNEAARGGHLDALRFLDDEATESVDLETALAYAVQYNRRDVFDYIRERHPNSWKTAVDSAYSESTRPGLEDYEKELKPHRGPSGIRGALYGACVRGELPKVDQILTEHAEVFQQHPEFFNNKLKVAAGGGHWSIMQRLVQSHRPSEREVVEALLAAINNGQIDIVLNLLKNSNGGLGSVQSGIELGVMPSGYHPSMATAMAQLLILAKHNNLRPFLVDRLTPATKLVYSDALPGAIEIAEKHGFSDSEVQSLKTLAPFFITPK